MPISLKTGGGGLPISTILPLNSTQTVYTPEEGGVWLRSGTITDDLITYPEATPNLAAFFDNFFGHASELTDARTVITDGTDFWVIGVGRIAYKYDSAGAYTGTSVPISTTMLDPRGGIWDGTNYWVTDGTAEFVVQYDSSFSVTGTEFDISAEISSNAQGLAWDGTYLYIAGNNGASNSFIFRYDAAGAYTGFSFSFENEATSIKDLEFFDGFLWVMTISGSVFKYGLDGIYTGDFFEIAATSETTNPYAITSDSESFWIGGSNKNIVSQFTAYAGIAFIAFDTDSGKPLYVKVA